MSGSDGAVILKKYPNLSPAIIKEDSPFLHFTDSPFLFLHCASKKLYAIARRNIPYDFFLRSRKKSL